MLLKVGGQLLIDDVVHQSTDIGVAQLGLGLALELGLRQLDGDDAAEALAAVLAADLVSVGLDDIVFLTVGIQNAGQGRFKARFVHTAFRRMDVVGKGQNGLIVAVVILHGHLGDGVALLALHVDGLGMQGRFGPVEPGGKLPDAALIVHGVLLLHTRAAVGGGDAKTAV